MNLDHVAVNAVELDREITFFVDFLGMRLLQRWEDPRQAYVGFDDGPVVGIIENPAYDGSHFTMAHLAFSVPEVDFEKWVARVKTSNLEVLSGPKPQRGGKSLLFRSPSRNIIELCYPDVHTSITSQNY